MAGIDVQLSDQGPATFEVLVQSVDGEELSLPRDHPDVREIEELAFGRFLRAEVRPLPAGAIRVRVRPDEWGEHPFPDEVAEAVARRLLS
jgi:hypothetical protein